jgi:hypothetical protein
MKKTAVLLLMLGMCACAASAQPWKEEKGDHFIVFYVNDAARPKEIIRKAEFHYNKVASDLGYARHSKFWQWDNRVKIYIHPTKEAFQQATGQPAWSHGMASYLEKSIHSIEGGERFLDAILPHEIAHLVFRDFIGFRNEVPLWMDEGVAQWQEDDKRRDALNTMPELVASSEIFTLSTLMTHDIRLEPDPRRVAIFYTQSISLIDFLVKTFGASSFTDFCRELRDGKPLEDALRSAYPHSLRSIEDLEDRWRKYVVAMRSKENEQNLSYSS